MMLHRFDDIAVGDQLEMPARGRHAPPWLALDGDTRDPERPVRVVVVTHRWRDPVDDRDYVALAPIGEIGMPKTKHTVTGLAHAGWRPARRDWLAYAREVILMRRKR